LFRPAREPEGPSGINPGFPGLSRCRGQVIHVLLTRSPLSPGPKPWFSLDLHVLGAPPAFVLSQDQTLREETDCPAACAAGRTRVFLRARTRRSANAERLAQRRQFSSHREGRTIHDGIDDVVRRCPADRTQSDDDASRRTRTLLSFQGPVPGEERATKRPPLTRE